MWAQSILTFLADIMLSNYKTAYRVNTVPIVIFPNEIQSHHMTTHRCHSKMNCFTMKWTCPLMYRAGTIWTWKKKNKQILALNQCSDKITWFQCLQCWGLAYLNNNRPPARQALLGSKGQHLAETNYSLLLVSIPNVHKVFLIFPKCWNSSSQVYKGTVELRFPLYQTGFHFHWVSTDLQWGTVTQYNYIYFTSQW